jgi:hypothetical protein
MARDGRPIAGRVPVQLRFQSGHTSDEYVTLQLWLRASLPCCPLHPKGGCGFARHGTYARVEPPGTRIARWYCPQGHCTFSLLPDHLAARFPGTLADIEAVVAVVETSPSQEAAANRLRLGDVNLTSAVRWVRRRLRLVRLALITVVSLLPDLFCGTAPTVTAFGRLFPDVSVLITLRSLAAAHLATLPRPLGFRPPGTAGGGRKKPVQHDTGPDPPADPG